MNSYKKIILIVIAIVFTIGTVLITLMYLVYVYQKEELLKMELERSYASDNPIMQRDMELMQGDWVHSNDSIAQIIIQDNLLWLDQDSTSKFYLIEEPFIIEWTDSLPQYVPETGPDIRFMTLKNDSDTLVYQILELNDSIFSLKFFPGGNEILYYKMDRSIL